MKSYGKLTVGLVAVWFICAFAASALRLFANNANRIGLSVGLAALIPTVLFFLWLAVSPKFRQFALSLDPRILTFANSWRVLGMTFVMLEAYRLLPAIFAFPAGFGDIAIGLTAPFVAGKLATPNHRGTFIFWQALGILDLVTAVALGTTAGVLSPQAPSMLPMTVLPLSLIPTFLVPLYLIFHIICIAQATAWKAATVRGVVTVGYQTPRSA